MSYTMTTSLAIMRKAGIGASGALTASAAAMQDIADKAEGVVCVLTRRNWVSDYSGVNSQFQNYLQDLTSDVGALELAKYDKSGYQSETEQQTILDILTDKIRRGLDFLRDTKNQSFN